MMTTPKPAQEIAIKGLTADSRDVAEGFLFAALPGTRADGRAFIEDAFRDLVRDLDAPNGRRPCLVMNDSGDVERREEAVARRMRRGAEQFEDVFRTAVERAQRDGDIPAAKNPDALARYLMSSRSGLLAVRKAGASKDELQDIIDVTLSALDH